MQARCKAKLISLSHEGGEVTARFQTIPGEKTDSLVVQGDRFGVRLTPEAEKTITASELNREYFVDLSPVPTPAPTAQAK